jgi:hypothetical protein
VSSYSAIFHPGEAPPLRRAGDAGHTLPRPLLFLPPMLLQWRGSSTGRLYSRREGLQMCIASLLDCNFAMRFASSLGGYAFMNSSFRRGKNAFANCCWTQPKTHHISKHRINQGRSGTSTGSSSTHRITNIELRNIHRTIHRIIRHYT